MVMALLPWRPIALVLALSPATTHAETPTCADSVGRVADSDGGADAPHRRLDAWLGSFDTPALDAVAMSSADIARTNTWNSRHPGAFQDVLNGPARSQAAVDAELDERVAFMRGRLDSGAYIEAVPGAFAAALVVIEGAAHVDEIRALAAHEELRCVPTVSGLFKPPIDPDFDRNQCSRLHLGELVRVHRVSRDGRWLYVHAGHSVGWLEAPEVTPPLGRSDATRFRDAEDRLVIVDDWVPVSGGQLLRLGTVLPHLGTTDAGDHHVQLPTDEGLVDGFISAHAAARPGYLPLTRRHVLTLALARVGDPYGWGGAGGGRDCSRLLRDTFRTFGLELGRHSGVQAVSGVRVIDVEGLSEAAKLTAIRAAGARGVVFLYMPGHIMLYLGELDGTPYALSAISEVLVPCADGGDRVVRLDRVDVTDLEPGRGTERTAFIERINKLAVFGP